MGGRGSSSGMDGRSGGVTLNNMPSATVDNIQKFVGQFGTGMSAQEMATKVYNALPAVKGGSTVHGVFTEKGAYILNDRYIQLENGPTLQFIKQKSKGTWKVKII